MGKRPLKDFEDPRLKGEVITEDFRSILQVAVLCVAKSHKGRPSIDQVFQELDRAWKNTAASMVGIHTWIILIHIVRVEPGFKFNGTKLSTKHIVMFQWGKMQ